MEIILILCIAFLGYFIIGGLYLVIFIWDEVIDIVCYDGSSTYEQYMGIIITILKYTPYNIAHDIKSLIKRRK